MAATIAKACGQDSTRSKRVHRLGSQEASTQAATWQTFVDATVKRDGSGYVEIRRQAAIVRVYFGPESEPLDATAEGAVRLGTR